MKNSVGSAVSDMVGQDANSTFRSAAGADHDPLMFSKDMWLQGRREPSGAAGLHSVATMNARQTAETCGLGAEREWSVGDERSL